MVAPRRPMATNGMHAAYLYQAVDQHGQVVDGYLSARRDRLAARSFPPSAGSGHDSDEGDYGPSGSLSVYSTSISQRLRTSSSGMPISPSKPTTVGSNRGCLRCAV